MDITTFLLPVALKGLALAAVIVVACSALRRARGAVLHAVLAALFAALVALPLLQISGPAWRVPVALLQAEVPTADASATEVASSGDVLHAERSRASASGGTLIPLSPSAFADTAPARTPQSTSGADATAAASVERAEPAEASAYDGAVYAQASRGVSWSVLVLGAWSAGALLVALYWALALASAARLVRAAQPVTDGDWLEALAHAQRSLGHVGTVRLLQSDGVSTPFAWGLGSPAVVLPASSDDWDAAARAAVLQHEVAHLTRRDPHVQIVAQVALALHWVNPFAWAAYRQLLLARERACDDAALAGGVAPSAYAGLLLGVARLARASAASAVRERVVLSAVSSMARPSELERRIVCVLDPAARRGGGAKRVRMVLGLGVLAALIPLAAFRPVAAADETDAGRSEADASAVAAVSAATTFGSPLTTRASARASSALVDPARVASSTPSATRPLSPPSLAQQSPPLPPTPQAPPSLEPRPAPSQSASSHGLDASDDSTPGPQSAPRARPTPAAAVATDPTGGVDWDAVTAARLAAEAALRQRQD